MRGDHAPTMPPGDPTDPTLEHHHGTSWLIIATDGPATELGGHVAAGLTIVDTDERFVRILLGERPRVAILGLPPAGPDALRSAALERSRRPALRLVLVNDPADVAGR